MGLTAAEVAERVARGEVNNVPEAPSRTTAEIIRANVFTRFNALIGSLFAIVDGRAARTATACSAASSSPTR